MRIRNVVSPSLRSADKPTQTASTLQPSSESKPRPADSRRLRLFQIRALLISLLALVPCFWQRRIQAGDLASHIYNAWLAQQIDLGNAPALAIVPISTNILFDVFLSRLYRTFGSEPAQHIAVSAAALIFFWGAFEFVCRMSGRRPWFLTPCLLMVTYGWVFHSGFFNFYLAAGLSLWALVLSSAEGLAARVVMAALLAIAYTAHAMPPAWALCVIAYTWISPKLPGLRRLFLFGLSFSGILALRFWIHFRYHSKSTIHQTLEAVAIDQVWVFGVKYWTLTVALALLWGFLFLRISHTEGITRILRNTSFQLAVLMALGILLLPTSIELPQYNIALSNITERMTLLHAVLICSFLAIADPPNWLRFAFIPLVLAYFSLIYADTNALNDVERRMEVLTNGLTLNDRVFTSFEDPNCRVQLWGHNLDRVCLGKCISYANYEPFTKQFRIRALRQNPLVVANPLDYAALADGGYVVKQRDLPFYQITLCGERPQELCLHRLDDGAITRHDRLSVLPALW